MGQQTQQPLLLILETRGGGGDSEEKYIRIQNVQENSNVSVGGLQLRSIGYSSASCLIYQDI